jgi:hypothetical protein
MWVSHFPSVIQREKTHLFNDFYLRPLLGQKTDLNRLQRVGIVHTTFSDPSEIKVKIKNRNDNEILWIVYKLRHVL